eukprot:900674-Alexandrium_andersonii.AAC.1
MEVSNWLVAWLMKYESHGRLRNLGPRSHREDLPTKLPMLQRWVDPVASPVSSAMDQGSCMLDPDR